MSETPALSSKGVLSHGIVAIAAQALNAAVTYFAILIIINELGEVRYGMFSYTMVIIGITSMLADFGMNPVLLRQMSRTPGRSGQIVLEATLARLILIVPAAILTNVIGLIQRQEADFMVILNIMLLNMIFSAKLPIIRGTFETLFRSRARMSVPVLLALLDSAVLLLLALGWRQLFRLPRDAMIAYSASNLGGFFILLFLSLAMLRRGPRSSLRIEWKSIRILLRESAPLALFLILNALHLYIDSIYLDHYFSKQEVGEYNAALRLIIPLLSIPTMVGWAVAPFIARFSAQADPSGAGKIRTLFGLGMKTLLLFGACAAVIGWREAETFVRLAFGGKYAGSVTPLLLYLVSYPVVAMNLFQVEVNNALGRQSRNTWAALIMALVSAAAGAMVIPFYGVPGAAGTKAFSVAVGFLFLFVALRRDITWNALLTFLKALVLTLLMAGVSLLVPARFWVAQCFAAAAIAGIGLLAVRYYSAEEIQLWKGQLAPILQIRWRR